ncbi:MAG: hypothetical protein ACLRX5_05700 [Slackia sp.]
MIREKGMFGWAWSVGGASSKIGGGMMSMGCLAHAYEQALVAQGAGKMRRHRWRCRGQMAVECAFVFPVVAVIAFIVANALVFAGDCAAFDQIVREAVCMQADDGREDSGAAEVGARVVERLNKDHIEVSVVAESGAMGHVRYRATASYRPPFLSGATVFGARVPALTHEIGFTVSPYRKGVVV